MFFNSSREQRHAYKRTHGLLSENEIFWWYARTEYILTT